MGILNSKRARKLEYEDVADIEDRHPTPFLARRVLPPFLDPRSPTSEINRTPIQVEKTPDSTSKVPPLQLSLPRSGERFDFEQVEGWTRRDESMTTYADPDEELSDQLSDEDNGSNGSSGVEEDEEVTVAIRHSQPEPDDIDEVDAVEAAAEMVPEPVVAEPVVVPEPVITQVADELRDTNMMYYGFSPRLSNEEATQKICSQLRSVQIGKAKKLLKMEPRSPFSPVNAGVGSRPTVRTRKHAGATAAFNRQLVDKENV